MIPKTPEIVLTTKEETLAWLASHDETFNCFDHPVKSLWLCAELNRFEADSGFVYNDSAQGRIARENALADRGERRVEPKPRMRTTGGLLGYLVYLAQGYRREMSLQQAGWVRASQDTLAPHEGKIVPALNNGSLSGEITAKVKLAEGRFRLCPPRSRNKAYAEYEDWWIRPAGGGQ